MKPEKNFNRALLRAITKKGLVINIGDEYYSMRFEKELKYCKKCELCGKCIKYQMAGLMNFCVNLSSYAKSNTPMFKDVIFVKIDPNIDLKKDNLIVYLKD